MLRGGRTEQCRLLFFSFLAEKTSPHELNHRCPEEMSPSPEVSPPRRLSGFGNEERAVVRRIRYVCGKSSATRPIRID